MGSVDLHLPVETVVEEEVVGHPHPMRLHGMALSVVVIPDVAVIIIANFRFAVALHSSLSI